MQIYAKIYSLRTPKDHFSSRILTQCLPLSISILVVIPLTPSQISLKQNGENGENGENGQTLRKCEKVFAKYLIMNLGLK
jgi:hypothetical protein